VRQENVFEENFKIKNQEYTLLTFNKESAPNLREAIAISDRRNERMLTVEEAIMIIADYESKTALSAILHADQRVTWSYLYTGKFSHTAASIGNDWSSRALHIAEHTDSGIYPSPNLLLKKHSAEEHVKFYDIKRTMLKSISR
jgi:hypothetical protein